MALEIRGNSRYYYEKQRIGDKVRSVYSGKGETALLLNQWRLFIKQEKEERRELEKYEFSKDFEIEQILDDLAGLADLMTSAFYLTNGFHQHKRQWRRKRNG